MFDLRKAGYGEEMKFSRIQELGFHVRNRRNKRLGLWAAAKMRMPDDRAAEYARRIVLGGVSNPNDEALVRSLLADLKANGAAVGAAEIREEMARLAGIATTELGAEENPRPMAA